MNITTLATETNFVEFWGKQTYKNKDKLKHTPGRAKLDSMKPSFCTEINSSTRLPSTYRKSADGLRSGPYFRRHLVTTALITWLGPQRHRIPLPLMPVRPIGFL